MAIALADLLEPRNVLVSLRSRTAENAVRELVTLLATNEELAEADQFAQQVIAREQTNPSAIEEGVVFPHARTDLVPKILLAIGRKTAGIPFGPQGARAKLIFLIAVPQRLVSDYLICVGALARVARNGTARTQLMRAKSAEELVQILKTASSL
jgi:mannitol/fructose-specific phosphotransferase system IIA component (Ntr-type)